MTKKKANHQVSGMNHAKAQGKDVGYNGAFQTEIGDEPLSETQRQNNKKTKKRQ
ncbi:small acid-soluble spore protein O [Halalkalibacter nanhaiisediminis]|uniref:Small acid-soluble spore protein O n=1 Tax=Halalkalibacter nanhaiisediminis TaxID=688079 RepID=A0A562QR91_9BACI|nr:small acid-soluble spore protein O [Halalkalibacter nanhaiisediminis]TWI59279.1 small acid-soluble spore protein O (minor) [Halalkalibacter nanhaiisediminis]